MTSQRQSELEQRTSDYTLTSQTSFAEIARDVSVRDSEELESDASTGISKQI